MSFISIFSAVTVIAFAFLILTDTKTLSMNSLRSSVTESSVTCPEEKAAWAVSSAQWATPAHSAETYPTLWYRPYVMTRKEIELLSYLLTHRGQILSREHLLNNVWDNNGIVLERTVDVHITHLRKKLGQYGKRIVTKSGYGYMFSV